MDPSDLDPSVLTPALLDRVRSGNPGLAPLVEQVRRSARACEDAALRLVLPERGPSSLERAVRRRMELLAALARLQDQVAMVEEHVARCGACAGRPGSTLPSGR